MTTLIDPVVGRLRPVRSDSRRLPARDAQIDALRGLLAAQPTAALSFDCFDTLLWRGVPKPVDVFLLLGRRLQDLGLLRPKTTPELFMKMRVLAEQAVRSQAVANGRSHEITLAEIYNLVGWQRQTSLSGPELVRHEVIVESSITTADPWFAEFLDELAEEDEPRQCFIVSDTYLDTPSLRFLLAAAGLESLADVPVFTSCEHGISKTQGLLRVALSSLGVDPARCIHIGNSIEHDMKPALQLKVGTLHVPEANPLAYRAMAVEGWYPTASDVSELVDPVTGDSGLSALRGRISRHKPESVGADDALFWDVGASTLGPVFTGFAEWVHERAGELGIETALCLMREGRFLAHMLDGVPAGKRTCTAVPFWASCEACIKATFFSGTKPELSRMLWRPDAPTPEALLATLGLTEGDITGGREVVAAIRQVGGPMEVANALIDFLSSQEDIRGLIVERSAARRKAYVKYLLSSLAGAGRTVALIDLGFGGTIQELLHNMTAAEGEHVDFRGLYLFTSPRALLRQLNGHVIEGFLADTGSNQSRMTTLDRSPEILEVITTSSDGSLLEITGDGRPQLADRGPQGSQDRQRLLVQDGIRAFQREWYFFGDHNSLGRRRHLGSSADTLHRILARFIGKPGLDIAQAFGDWNHDANFGSDRRDALVPETIRRCAGYLAPEHLALLKTADLYWVGAAAAHLDIEDEVTWLQDGRAPLGKFIHGDGGGQLRLTIASPAGAPPLQVEAPILVYKTGTGALAWSGQTDSHQFVLRTSGPGAILRLDQLSVARRDGSVDHYDWRTTKECPAGVRLSADVEIADGVALISDTDALRITLTSKKSLAITGVEILYGALLS